MTKWKIRLFTQTRQEKRTPKHGFGCNKFDCVVMICGWLFGVLFPGWLYSRGWRLNVFAVLPVRLGVFWQQTQVLFVPLINGGYYHLLAGMILQGEIEIRYLFYLLMVFREQLLETKQFQKFTRQEEYAWCICASKYTPSVNIYMSAACRWGWFNEALFLFETAETQKMRLFWPCLFRKRWKIAPNWSWWMQVETDPSGDSFPPPKKKTSLQGSQAVFSENIITMHQLKMYWSVSGSRWGFAEISGSWRFYLLAVEAFINNSTQPTAQPLNFWKFWGLHVYVGKVKFKRIFQHTPGTHPRPQTNFGDAWGMLQGYRGVPIWKKHGKPTSKLFDSWNRLLKSRPSARDLIFDYLIFHEPYFLG